MALVQCPDCGREVSDAAPACPGCGRPASAGASPAPEPAQKTAKPQQSKTEIAIGCFGLLVIGAFVGSIIEHCACDSRKAATAPQTYSSDPAPAPKPSASRECRLSMDGDDAAVFPTEEGLREFIAAGMRGDDAETESAFRANHGFWVAPGTRCVHISGFLTWKVRVLDGPHAGRAGYVPLEFAGGR